MPSFPVKRRFCTAATCWMSRITNSEEGVVQCAPMVNVPHSPLHECVPMSVHIGATSSRIVCNSLRIIYALPA